MSGDYSRRRFDQFKDFAAVLQQQGRVVLDADWNEQNGILQRRWRAETVDIIGRCVVPRETSNAFQIEPSGNTNNKQMTIGPGRMYVDGHLAENHGAEPFTFDLATPHADGRSTGVLGEPGSASPILYEEQPYRHEPDYPNPGGPHVVYLDVWEREVTAIHDPGLLEEALGGIDTTTRLQTVWQVRFLEEDIPPGTTCATPDAEIPGWPEIIAASAGRLSTRTHEEEEPSNPCLLPPSGGYRGLENQLYRVELHNPGGPGVATFKWSRDNASVTTRILEFLGSDTVRVATLGRDEVLGFAVGNWVEITDDHHEWEGLPGHMALVEAIDPDTREMTLVGEIPPEFRPTDGDTPAARNSRITRWDQRGAIFDAEGNELVNLDDNSSGGVIPVPADPDTWVRIEHGVEISFNFEPAEGRMRSGDYWQVAARTASASIEELDHAPPRGIHHHYCRLAVVEWFEPNPANPAPQVLDCRNFWPPEIEGDHCACTVCVTAESHNNGTLTIQQAVSQVTGTGGTVCLGPGNFFLGEPINIVAAQSVTLTGQGPRTALFYPGQGSDPEPAISVEGSWGVVIEDLAVVTSGSQRASAIGVRTSASVGIEKCLFLQLPPRGESVLPMISIGGAVVDLSIQNNEIFANVGIQAVPVAGDAIDDGAPQIAIADLYICHNHMFCDLFGVSLEPFVLLLGETDISDNFIHGSIGNIRVVGVTAAGAPVDIARNSIRTTGDGIVLAVDGARVHDNDITAVRLGQDGNGIVLTEVPGNENGIDCCQVVGNCIADLGGTGILINAHVRSVMIKQNFVTSTARGGIVMDPDSSADDLIIENNQIRDVASINPEDGRTLPAIDIMHAQHVAVVGNTIDGVALHAIGSPNRAAIHVVASGSIRVAGNQMVNIGPGQTDGSGVAQIGGSAIGIAVVSPFDRVDLTDNSVLRSRARPANPDPIRWSAIHIQRVATPFHLTDRLTLLPADDAGNVLHLTTSSMFALLRGQEIVAICGNILESHESTASLVTVSGQGTCIFANNRCVVSSELLNDFPPAENCVALTVRQAIVNSNSVEGPPGTTPIRLNPQGDGANLFTVMGNITTGPVRFANEPLPERWRELNVSAL